MMLILEVFLAFVRVGAMVFGGAYAAIPIIEQEVVGAQAWMTYAEFMDLLALDEITPGPIIINSATFIGMKVAGVPGAIAATLGCITVPCLAAFALLLLFRKYKEAPLMKDIMLSLKCMAVALIASTMINLVYSCYVLAVVAVSFYLMHMKKLRPLPVMLGCGVLNLLVSGFIL